MRLAPPAVKEAYCILRNHRMSTLLELAACQSSIFNATPLPSGSDERQQSGRIKAVGRWFESGRCVGAFNSSV